MDLATQTRCNELFSHLLTLPQRPAGSKAASLVLMEVCNFASVDLREVGYLFKAFEVEMEPGLAGQAPVAGETEKEGK